MNNNTQLLDYLITHPDATIQYRAFNMILNIHSEFILPGFGFIYISGWIGYPPQTIP